MRNQGAPSVHKGRIAYLDGWRGLAILAVPIGHFVPSLGQAGSLGVELFFVLSGRLMASILFEEKIPAEQLFAGRFPRIYPGLLLYCAAIFFVSVTAQGMGIWWKAIPSALDVLSAMKFTINYVIPLIGSGRMVNHIWSVSVEEHCYVLLALIALFVSRRAGTTSALASVSPPPRPCHLSPISSVAGDSPPEDARRPGFCPGCG